MPHDNLFGHLSVLLCAQCMYLCKVLLRLRCPWNCLREIPAVGAPNVHRQLATGHPQPTNTTFASMVSSAHSKVQPLVHDGELHNYHRCNRRYGNHRYTSAAAPLGEHRCTRMTQDWHALAVRTMA
jgi:hypothetical protein